MYGRSVRNWWMQGTTVRQIVVLVGCIRQTCIGVQGLCRCWRPPNWKPRVNFAQGLRWQCVCFIFLYIIRHRVSLASMLQAVERNQRVMTTLPTLPLARRQESCESVSLQTPGPGLGLWLCAFEATAFVHKADETGDIGVIPCNS